jgi:hypothetical protein
MSIRSLVIVVFLAIPGVAAAQSASAPPDARIGLFGGFSVQGGNMSCSGMNCNTFRKAGGADVHVGWAFGPHLALIGDVYALTSTEDSLTITQTIATVGLRYWVVPIFWLQAGVGGADARFTYSTAIGNFSAHSNNAAGVTLAAGLELLRTKRFSLDIELRDGQGFYPGNSTDPNKPDDTGRNSSFGVGFTWF